MDATEPRVQAVAKASMRMCVYMYGLGIETKMDVVYRMQALRSTILPVYQCIAQKEGSRGPGRRAPPWAV